MRVISRRKLREFWERYPDAEQPLKAWFSEASNAEWNNFAEVRQMYGSADRVGERIVFNIGGNKYRLVVLADFRRHGLLIRFVGTHKDYDAIDVRTI